MKWGQEKGLENVQRRKTQETHYNWEVILAKVLWARIAIK